MPLLSAKEQAEYEELGLEAPHALVNRLMVGFSVILTVPLYMSLSRLAYTEWLPIYSIHIGLYSLILLSTLLRNRLRAKIKAAILIFGSLAVAFAGHYSFGLMAGSVFYLPIAAALLVFYFDIRQVILFGVLTVAAMGVIAYGFISGTLSSAIDAAVMQRSAQQWFNYCLSLSVFFTMTVFIMRSYGSILRGMIDRISEQKDEIVKLTHFDRLTGVATLPLAIEYIEEALSHLEAEGGKGALLLVHIGDIAAVNNLYGFDAGELVLRAISERLILLLRPEDKLARISDCNYLIIVSKMKNKNRVAFLADMVIDSLKAPIRSVHYGLIVRGTIGIAMFPDEHAADARSLIKKANDARLLAEQERKNQTVLE